MTYIEQPRIIFRNTARIVCGELREKPEFPEAAFWFEESAELTKEVSKFLRGKGNKAALTEEIADVYLVLANLRQIYGVGVDEIEDWINRKYARYGFDLLPIKERGATHESDG